MSIYRDIQLKRESREAQKQDKLPFRRAVLVNQYGEQTSLTPMDEVWADESARRVWYMADGATQPGQILCVKVSDPWVGLGVIYGYSDGSNQLEVLCDDFFLRGTGDPTGWVSTSPRDLEPGGKKQLWLYTKAVVPLMTYPSAGLTVIVAGGDYSYNGERKTFGGYLNFPLTAPGTVSQHYLAGLYLDASNTLQVVYGAAVATTLTAPEPAWPAAAFRLSAILIENGQTTIDFDTDVFDRRMPWSDEHTGGMWPGPDEIKIGSTVYPTLAAACAAAASGDLIKFGEGTFLTAATIPAGVSLLGSGVGVTFIGNSGASNTLTFAGESFVANFTVYNDSTGVAVEIGTGATVTMRNIQETEGGISLISTGVAVLWNCLTATVETAGTSALYVYEGEIDTSVTVTAGSISLFGPRVPGTVTGTLVAGSWYFDTNGNKVEVGAAKAGHRMQLASNGPITTIKDNLAGTVAPTVNDDSGDGYAVNSLWYDTVARLIYRCWDATAAAADWRVLGNLTANKVKNTSGATAAVGEVGYITWTSGSGIEYKTTTTANDNRIGSVAVVIVGGANNADIYVVDFGRHTVPYAGSAPNAGDYLVYSTTAGKLAAQTTMSPDVCAVAMAAGSGGNVDALMIARTTPVDLLSSVDLFRCNSASLSDFVGTIATLPGGAVLTYNITSGNENTLDAAATTQLAKITLHNTTRGTSALISDTVTGTNTITLTTNVPAGWQVGDTITPRSQTITGTLGSSYWYDLEIADTATIPVLARAVSVYGVMMDTGGGGYTAATHPFISGAYAAGSTFSATNEAASQYGINTWPVPLYNRKLGFIWTASGSGTGNPLLRLAGFRVASP